MRRVFIGSLVSLCPVAAAQSLRDREWMAEGKSLYTETKENFYV